MYNPNTSSQHEIVLGEQSFRAPYDEMLTDATLVLAAMQRHDVRAFEAALKFPFISESMTYVERYNKMYAFCKGWIKPKRKVEGDDYASASEWRAFFEWRQSRK